MTDENKPAQKEPDWDCNPTVIWESSDFPDLATVRFMRRMDHVWIERLPFRGQERETIQLSDEGASEIVMFYFAQMALALDNKIAEILFLTQRQGAAILQNDRRINDLVVASGEPDIASLFKKIGAKYK